MSNPLQLLEQQQITTSTPFCEVSSGPFFGFAPPSSQKKKRRQILYSALFSWSRPFLSCACYRQSTAVYDGSDYHTPPSLAGFKRPISPQHSDRAVMTGGVGGGRNTNNLIESYCWQHSKKRAAASADRLYSSM